MDMVNKYGLLPLNPAPSKHGGNQLNPGDTMSLNKLVTSLAAPQEVKDMTVIIDCLAAMANEDGKPMIYW